MTRGISAKYRARATLTDALGVTRDVGLVLNGVGGTIQRGG